MAKPLNVPIILKKDHNKSPLLKNIKLLSSQTLYREDVIYNSSKGDFLRGEFHKVTIVNRYNFLTNNTTKLLTVAKCETHDGYVIEKSSETITKLIGQANYDLLFSTLCSVISQELKIRGILSLLTVSKKTNDISCQTVDSSLKLDCGIEKQDIGIHTEDNLFGFFKKGPREQTKRQQLSLYVVKDKLVCDKKVKRIVINPEDFKEKVSSPVISDDGDELHLDESDAKLPISGKKTDALSCQTADNTCSLKSKPEIESEEIGIQTDVNLFDFFKKKTPRKRAKRHQLCPYVVKDTSLYDKKLKVNRVVITPEDFKEKFIKQVKPVVSDDSNELQVDESKSVNDVELPLIPGNIFDENSRESIGNLSMKSLDEPRLLTNPSALLNIIEKFTDTPQYPIEMLDHTVIYVPIKPENPYYVASSENLQHLNLNERKKLLFHQAYLDWKYCLDVDEDGNRPIHVAVLNNDLQLLRRQCLVLKARKRSVDIAENLTALQMAISLDHPKCTEMLLSHGANPLLTNEEHKTALHSSAEASLEQLTAVINCCKANARKFLLEDKDLWEPRFENRSDEELGKHLLEYMSTMFDIQGYTPLMLASKLGKADNVELLIKSAPSSINIKTPNSGNTALYLVVESACIDASERANKSKVSDNFSRTIEVLVENGADQCIDNYSGSNINVLLNEFSIGELSMLIANKLTSVKFGEIKGGNFDSYMLVKNEDGEVNKKLIKEKSAKIKTGGKPIIAKDMILSQTKKGNSSFIDTNKPVILEHFRISPGNKFEKDAPTDVKSDKQIPVIIENVQMSNKRNILNRLQIEIEPRSPKQIKDGFMKNIKQIERVNVHGDGPRLFNKINNVHPSKIEISPKSSDKIKIIQNELLEDPLKIHFPSEKCLNTETTDGPSKRKIINAPGTSKKQKTTIDK